MSVILDQREQTGDPVHQTVDDIVAYWEAWARQRGFRREGVQRNDLATTDLVSDVYISGSRYVADCPNRTCNGAASCWIENPRACCLDCGTVFKVRWPDEKEIGGTMAEVADVLLQRPRWDWRNFRASNKEDTLADLKAENLAMGDPLPGGHGAAGPHPLDPAIRR